MKIKLMNENILEMLRNIPDESVDCVVSSPPYYGLRDYSGVATYASDDYDELIRIANIDLQNHRDRVLESQRDRYYLTKPVFNEKDKKWHTSLKYDISGIWGGNPECDHEWVNQEIHKNNLRFRDPNHKASVGNHKNQEIYSSSNVKTNSCSKCSAWKGQLGLEPTYQMYIDHLMLIMKELKRILKKTGTLFWNMGDSYASSGGPSRHFGYPDPKWDKARNGSFEEPTAFKQGIKPKSLMGIPERFMIAMLDDGWVLRNKLPWIKMNAMPSSKKDGFTPKWEYVYFFTKSQSYYFDLDSIRKPLADSSIKRISQKNIPNQFKSGKSAEFAETNPVNNIPKIVNNMHKKYNGVYSNLTPEESEKYGSPRARNMRKRSYDSKYQESDYGQTLQGFSRNNTIEKARTQSHIDSVKLFPDDVEKQKEYIKNIHDHLGDPNGANPGDVLFDDIIYDLYTDPSIQNAFIEYIERERPELLMSSILDIPTMPHSFAHFAVFPETLVNPLIKAGCPANGVVLDPFAGSGTVGVVAKKQGKSAILIEISPEYAEIIKNRLEIEASGTNMNVKFVETASISSLEEDE